MAKKPRLQVLTRVYRACVAVHKINISLLTKHPNYGFLNCYYNTFKGATSVINSNVISACFCYSVTAEPLLIMFDLQEYRT